MQKKRNNHGTGLKKGEDTYHCCGPISTTGAVAPACTAPGCMLQEEDNVQHYCSREVKDVCSSILHLLGALSQANSGHFTKDIKKEYETIRSNAIRKMLSEMVYRNKKGRFNRP